MSSFVEIVIGLVTAVTGLLEAKMRLFRRSFLRLGWAIAFVALAALLLAAAMGFLLIGLYQYLASILSPVVASLLVALAALVLAFFFAVLAKLKTSDL